MRHCLARERNLECRESFIKKCTIHWRPCFNHWATLFQTIYGLKVSFYIRFLIRDPWVMDIIDTY